MRSLSFFAIKSTMMLLLTLTSHASMSLERRREQRYTPRGVDREEVRKESIEASIQSSLPVQIDLHQIGL